MMDVSRFLPGEHNLFMPSAMRLTNVQIGDEILTVIVDDAGLVVTWSEIFYIFDLAKQFYDLVPDPAIRRCNAKALDARANKDLDIVSLEEADRPVEGFVYLLKAGPYYKIGASTCVDKRVKQLRTLPPFDIELVCYVRHGNMYSLEEWLHKKFADKRKNGEWFELSDEDVEFIKGGMDGYLSH